MSETSEYYSMRRKIDKIEKSTDSKVSEDKPIMIRLDMIKGQKFMEKFEKPFDEIYYLSMRETLQEMCKINPCVRVGYTYSDEINLLLVINNSETGQSWYSGRIQKICAVCASKASVIFNKNFIKNVEKYNKGAEYKERYFTGLFDCKVFNIEEKDLETYYKFRQFYAEKYAVVTLAKTVISGKALSKMSLEEVKAGLRKNDIDYNIINSSYLKGMTCIKKKKVWTLCEIDFNTEMEKIEVYFK